MITINVKVIVAWVLLIMLVALYGSIFGTLVMGILSIPEGRWALFWFSLGWGLHFNVGWNAALRLRKQQAVQKAEKEEQQDRR